MKKRVMCVIGLLSLMVACSASAFSYSLLGSNDGDSDGPAVGTDVTVYLAAANTNSACNPYAGSTNCAADCATSPSDCTEVGTLSSGVSDVSLTPDYAQNTASVWIGYGGQYYQCTPDVCTGTLDTITAHMGGCLGNT